MRPLASPFCSGSGPWFIGARLFGDEGLAEGADDAFDHSTDVEGEIEVVDFFEGEFGDPGSELFGDLPIVGVGVIANPLSYAPIDAGAEGFHEIVGEGSGMLAGGVSNAEGGVDPYGKEILQHGGEKNGIAVVEKGIGAAFVPPASEVIGLGDVVGVEAPKQTGSFGLFGSGPAFGESFEPGEAVIFGSEFVGEGELVSAFGIDGFVPETLL